MECQGCCRLLVATDDLIPTQTVIALAWNYKGFVLPFVC